MVRRDWVSLNNLCVGSMSNPLFSHVQCHSHSHLYLFWQLLLLILSHFYWSFLVTTVTFYMDETKNYLCPIGAEKQRNEKCLTICWNIFFELFFHDPATFSHERNAGFSKQRLLPYIWSWRKRALGPYFISTLNFVGFCWCPVGQSKE